jgi:hypothetical protein
MEIDEPEMEAITSGGIPRRNSRYFEMNKKVPFHHAKKALYFLSPIRPTACLSAVTCNFTHPKVSPLFLS